MSERFTAVEIKAMIAGYFRYKKQCPIIAFEASNRLKWATGEPADILVVSESRMLYEIEGKLSLSDLKNDKKKGKHYMFRRQSDYLPVYKFYFATPKELSNAALDIVREYYPYAGLLAVSKFPFNSAALDFGVQEVISPKHLNNKPLPMKDIIYLVKEQSGTICRLARDKALAERTCKKVQSENIELNKSLTLAGVTN